MKSSTSMRALSPFLFATVVGSLLHCGGGGPKESFTSQGDTAVMGGIVGTWVGTSSRGATFTMSLCENTGSMTSKVSCGSLHTVRGGGRGATETVTDPGGCGGCDYDNSAYVVGVVSGDDLQSTAFSGQFVLTGGDANSLAFPYRIEMFAQSTQLNGSMESPGTITLASALFEGASNATGDAGDRSSNSNDASDGATSDGVGDSSVVETDADVSDAGESDASESDASALATGGDDASTDTNGVDAGGVDAGDDDAIVFHRVDGVTCPLP